MNKFEIIRGAAIKPDQWLVIFYINDCFGLGISFLRKQFFYWGYCLTPKDFRFGLGIFRIWFDWPCLSKGKLNGNRFS